jgi:hypothetical protein
MADIDPKLGKRPEDAISVWALNTGINSPWGWRVSDAMGNLIAEGVADDEPLARHAARKAFDEYEPEQTEVVQRGRWTVVGYTEDRGQNRVEYVLARDSEHAAEVACLKNPQLMVVAVFEGRVVDQLASESACRWPLSDEESEDGSLESGAGAE